jgi:hypothetical protein
MQIESAMTTQYDVAILDDDRGVALIRFSADEPTTLRVMQFEEAQRLLYALMDAFDVIEAVTA